MIHRVVKRLTSRGVRALKFLISISGEDTHPANTNLNDVLKRLRAAVREQQPQMQAIFRRFDADRNGEISTSVSVKCSRIYNICAKFHQYQLFVFAIKFKYVV